MPLINGQPPPTAKGGGLPPSLAPPVRHPSTPPRRGRACSARSLASAPGFVLHPLYLLHRREGLRGCEQGPRLSGAKPGCEQCLPLRGKQPHERVCEANWRRSLCAAKRPRPPAGGEVEAPLSKGAGRVSGLGDSDGLCVAAHSRATSAREKGPGCRPPSPLSSTTFLRQSVGAGHARPAASSLPPLLSFAS